MQRPLALAVVLLLGALPLGGQPAVAQPLAGQPVAARPVAAQSVATPAAGAVLPLSVLSSGGSWRWPVPAPHVVARPFVAPATPYSSGHRGIDIRSDTGQVYAPAAGVVSFAGVVVDRPVLSIRHPGGVVSSYEPVQTDLSAGDSVSQGQPIGILLAGHCAMLCLHFGVRVGGQYVSPLLFLGGIPPSVLLPTRR
ncbi:MAG: M23 family metallopeptidase [Pseudolysinimonas sp.]